MRGENVKIHIATHGSSGLSRTKTIALAIAALAVGGVFLALGIALLASLAVVGTAVAMGLAIARVVRGRNRLPSGERPLDPSMEVFPTVTREARQLEGESEER
jgi:hypothetical protein